MVFILLVLALNEVRLKPRKEALGPWSIENEQEYRPPGRTECEKSKAMIEDMTR